MNDHTPITPVTFNEATRKFTFQLPPAVCDHLQLPHFNKNGLALCHSDSEELESFREKLLSLNDSAEVKYMEWKKALQRKIIAALFFIVFVCLCIYANKFFGDGQFYRWLFNFVAVLVLIAMYKITAKYLLGKQGHTDTTRLQRDLDLLVIHNRVRDEFTC